MKKEKLFDLWEGRNPKFEVQYEEPVIKLLSDYGIGTTEYQASRGKILGAGYEVYIMAFFIGLYFDKTLPIQGETKVLGQPIRFWGNVDGRKGRHAYHDITKFIFAALVANSDVDFIALDKGNITARKAVDILISKMEEYANYGFHYMLHEHLESKPDYFFKNTAFLDIFVSQIKSHMVDDATHDVYDEDDEDESDEEPDPLD